MYNSGVLASSSAAAACSGRERERGALESGGTRPTLCACGAAGGASTSRRVGAVHAGTLLLVSANVSYIFPVIPFVLAGEKLGGMEEGNRGENKKKNGME